MHFVCNRPGRPTCPPRRRPASRLAYLLAALCLACSDVPPQAPELDLSALGEEAAARVGAARDALAAAPDSASAQRRLAGLLQAHGLFSAAAWHYGRARELGDDDFELAHLHGLTLAAIGEQDAAIAALRAARALNEGYGPTHLALADLLAQTGDERNAERAYRDALAALPDQPQALLGLGRLLLDDDPERGLHLLRRAGKAAGAYGAAHYAVAQALRDAGDREGAIAEFERFEQFRDAVPYLDDRVLARVSLLNRGRVGDFARGMHAYREGRLQDAAQEFENALANDGSNAAARQNLIAIYAQLGRFEDAEQQYRLGVESAPDFVRLHTNYALMHLNQGNYDAAITAYQAAIAVDPDYGKSYLGLGAVHESRGNRRTALKWYRRALEHEPENRQARHYVANVLVYNGAYRQAIDELTGAVEPDDVQSATSLRLLARAQAASGLLDQAEASLQRANDLARRFRRYDLARASQEDIDKLRIARVEREQH